DDDRERGAESLRAQKLLAQARIEVAPHVEARQTVDGGELVQARVLDRDRSLPADGLEQAQMIGPERGRLMALHRQYADDLVVHDERYAQPGANPRIAAHAEIETVVGLAQIRNRQRLLVFDHPPGNAFVARQHDALEAVALARIDVEHELALLVVPQAD